MTKHSQVNSNPTTILPSLDSDCIAYRELPRLSQFSWNLTLEVHIQDLDILQCSEDPRFAIKLS